jgi:hypothetical protein
MFYIIFSMTLQPYTQMKERLIHMQLFPYLFLALNKQRDPYYPFLSYSTLLRSSGYKVRQIETSKLGLYFLLTIHVCMA